MQMILRSIKNRIKQVGSLLIVNTNNGVISLIAVCRAFNLCTHSCFSMSNQSASDSVAI